MQIIKRSTLQRGAVNLQPYVTINADHIYFTKAACAKFKLQHNNVINFINDGRVWSFYKTADPDGFLLQKYSSGMRVHCMPLCRLILKQLTATLGVSYHLEACGEYQGHELIRILTAKPVEKA